MYELFKTGTDIAFYVVVAAVVIGAAIKILKNKQDK